MFHSKVNVMSTHRNLQLSNLRVDERRIRGCLLLMYTGISSANKLRQTHYLCSDVPENCSSSSTHPKMSISSAQTQQGND